MAEMHDQVELIHLLNRTNLLNHLQCVVDSATG